MINKINPRAARICGFRNHPLKIAVAAGIIGGLATLSASSDKTGSASPYVKAPADSEFKDTPVSGKNVKWGDLKPLDHGPKEVTYDLTGMRELPPLPPPGVHPRILFTAEQIPDLRRRLKETRVGQHMWNAIIGWTEEMKGRYDNNADYAKPDIWKGSFGTRGFICRFRGNHMQNGKLWNDLVAGNTDLHYKNGGMTFIWSVFPMEALRCLIEEDEEGGKQLAKAIETNMKVYNATKGTDIGTDNFTKYGLPGFNVAYTYDLAHKWLSPEGRKLLADHISQDNPAGDHYGSFEHAERTTSNWTTFTYDLTNALAIEGMPGFNDLKYLGYLRGYRNFYTYGWYESGACFEGMGKNQLGGDALVMFSLRGENIAGHPHALTYMRNRLTREMLPGTSQIVAYDRWGGLKTPATFDTMTMKYLFPNDPQIDWVNRKAIGFDEEHLTIGSMRPDSYWNWVLLEAIVADDPLPQKLTQEEAAKGEKTFFCGERNLMTTRSDWSDDALFFNFQTRPANGGHVFADRNSFVLSAKGLNWFVKRPLSYDTDLNSVVLIDGQLQSRMTPGRIVDFSDQPEATFTVGDTKYTWEWEVVVRDTWQMSMGIKPNGFTRLQRGGQWEPVWETSNDFSFKETPEPFLNKPLYERPYWFSADPQDWDMLARRPRMKVEKSFRTAGLVRGDNPDRSYVFIMDDIKVDDQEHDFQWLGQVDNHTKIWKTEESNPGTARPGEPFTRDIHLFQPKLIEGRKGDKPGDYTDQSEPEEGQPALLVRFVDMDSKRPLEEVVKLDATSFQGRQFVDAKAVFTRLIVDNKSVEPNFKVVVYPYIKGVDPLPVTQWRGDKLEVSWPDSPTVDEFAFTDSDTGKVDLSISRGGKTIADLSRPVKPTPDRTPEIDLDPEHLPVPYKAWEFDTDEGLEFTKGKYSMDNAKLEEGVLFFDDKGHQQVTLPEVTLPSSENFTVMLRLKVDKKPPCQIISGNGWSFSLGNWNAIALKFPGGSSAPRQTEEEIQSWFMDHWATVAIVKNGSQWALYVNGKLVVIGESQEPLPEGPMRLQLGDAAGNVAYGMLGRIDDVKIYDKALSFEQINALQGDRD